MRLRGGTAAAISFLLVALAACFSRKELVTAADDERDAGDGSDAGADVAVACEPFRPTDDVPADLPPQDGRASSAFEIDEEANIARDTETGLEWLRSPLRSLTYDEAACECARVTAGGHRDWRLPTRFELVGIVDYAMDIPPVDGPALDPDVFRDIAVDYYWTSTRYPTTDPSLPFLPVTVGIGDGRVVGRQAGLFRHPAWCVRGEGAKPVAKRFEVSTDTVKDVVTGLVWQRVLEERTWPQRLEPEIETYCAGLTLDGTSGFRLPTLKELHTLLKTGSTEPLIDEDAFPGTPAGLFHTSSRYGGKPTSQTNWTVDFLDGRVYPNTSLDPKSVRCVRSP